MVVAEAVADNVVDCSDSCVVAFAAAVVGEEEELLADN